MLNFHNATTVFTTRKLQVAIGILQCYFIRDSPSAYLCFRCVFEEDERCVRVYVWAMAPPASTPVSWLKLGQLHGVRDKLLRRYEHPLFVSCLAGLYSCQWRRYQRSRARPGDCCCSKVSTHSQRGSHSCIRPNQYCANYSFSPVDPKSGCLHGFDCQFALSPRYKQC